MVNHGGVSMQKLRVVVAGVVAATVVGVAGGETLVLWPSELCDARQHSDSRIEELDRGVIGVRTGTKYSWPGVTIFIKGGVYDLREYGPVRVAVRNTSERQLTINLSVKESSHKDGTPGGRVTLEPGESGLIKTSLQHLPYVLDKKLELVGMNASPAVLGGGKLDLEKVAEFHVFLNKPDHAGSFEVSRVELDRHLPKVLKADGFIPFVDKFGQFKHGEWPFKVHSEEEMIRAGKLEALWLAQQSGPANRNKWGGWTKGPQLEATGHFRTAKHEGKWWLVDPDGRLFFSHGVDCVRPGAETGITHRESYFEWLPEGDSPFNAFKGSSNWAPHGFYKGKGKITTFDFSRANMMRKYGGDWHKTHRELAHKRIRAWGLNTVANWSESGVYLMRQTPYTACTHIGSLSIKGSDGWWGKFPDPFAKEFAAAVEGFMEWQKRDGTIDDPWCIGYFVDNELSWGSDDRSLALAAWRSPADQPVKVAMRRWLEERYTTVEKLNAAWGSEFKGWDEFLQHTDAVAKGGCVADLELFHSVVAEHYFRVVRDTIKRVAPNKLYLGCRIAWGAPSVYRAASKYCDVVSVNIYNHTANRDLPEGSEDRPMINGEFHFGALDRGMFHTGLVAAKDQQERAEFYKGFVNSCLEHPRFVGTHWFQWRDQALTGRGDGENYQIGFLTVTDAPYPELVKAAQEVAASMYERRLGAGSKP